MKPYGNVIAVYAGRPLLRWSMAISLLLGGFAVAMRDNPTAYSIVAMVTLVVIMGVQVTGYLGVTAIQLIWNERARVMPGIRRAHLPVIVSLMLANLSLVVVAAALAKQNIWGMTAVASEIMAVGLWLVMARRWWVIPAGIYSVILGTNQWQMGRSTQIVELAAFDRQFIALSAAAIVAWLFKLFVLEGEAIDLNADFFIRVDSRLLDRIRRLAEIGPVWVLSRINWRRGSKMWRLSRWWARAGDGWMAALLLLWAYAPLLMSPTKIDEFFRVAKWRFSIPATMMTGLTIIPMILGMSMVAARGSVISMQAVWPVRRKAMLAEHLTIIVAEVAAMWVMAVAPMVVLAARGVEVFDWRMTIICITGSAATLALVIGVMVWLEQRRAMEIRGIMVMLGVYAVGLVVGRWVMEMSALAIAGCIVLIAVLAAAVWRDAVRRWVSTDFTRLPNEGKVLNV